ncbi:uncharacterized protein LOC114876038 [Osmia bicornis bicornis]|uniref:uncharacterized protein LOC114876038 n=1 Tax=Osmia bicornis bicornis TaxID=1437191 RepID=UPI0010F6EB77|nr:uncharacterized protein LOC114876038 [Osmia bicornis bicornis]
MGRRQRSSQPRRKAQYTSTHQQPQCCYPVLSHCCVADTDPRYCWWHGCVALPRFLFPSLHTTPLRRHAVRPSPLLAPKRGANTNVTKMELEYNGGTAARDRERVVSSRANGTKKEEKMAARERQKRRRTARSNFIASSSRCSRASA